MSDFFNDGWSIFIAVATIVSLLACLALLAFASRRQPMASDNSTGHVFDGDLVEMNNPLPMWWVVLFVLTVIFSFVYVYFFPGLGSAAGSLSWTSRGELAADQKRAAEAMAKVYAPFAGQSAEALSQDPKAMAIGQRLFLNNCSTCHGSDARGSKGFPNLTDVDWLHGGTPEKIEETITLGRTGVMPPMAAAVGTASDISDLANYVLGLSGSPHNSIAASSGRKKFVACAACHGPDGKGNPALGAPNLADKVWLHGWGEDAIADIVRNGKTSVMPGQAGRLTPEQIHLLAGYVWSLSQVRRTAQR
jgi:cytochrome c oxidase cbb3-type subunit III